MSADAAARGSEKRTSPRPFGPRSERGRDASDQREDDSAPSTAEEEVRKRKRPHRKGSHMLRKEEISRLQDELAALQAQMRELQQRALAPKRGEADGGSTKVFENVLRNVVKTQQDTFVDVQAAMAGYSACSIQYGSPIQRTLVLPKGEVARRGLLRSMRTLKLQDGRTFMRRRLAHLNPRNAMSEERRFENDEGDYWAVRFTTTQFESAHSVKQVFDLVMYFLSNSEISISEKVGHLTVREDDDNSEPGIAQHRLVSTTGKGLHMESNHVNFYEYRDDGPDRHDASGLVVSEFVDDDERHPYLPNTRIRKDANFVMEVRACSRRPRRTGVVDGRSFEDENVVVLSIWSHSHLRRPSFAVPRDAWSELRENMDRWSQNMHKTIMETLDPTI